MIDYLGRIGKGIEIISRIEYFQSLDPYDLVLIDELDELIKA
jgi:hypothetical protein